MTMRNSIPDQVPFTHIVLEGTPYQVGWSQGEALKNDPARAHYLTPPLPFLDHYSRQEAQAALAYYETYCPGIREEIQGAADAFGVPVEEIAFLGGKSKQDGFSPVPVAGPGSGTSGPNRGSHCSQFAVLPSATADGHLYAGQNVDCGPDDLDLRLCTTRVQGKPAHIAFSDMIFGRVDGLNEHGFCVTTSWGAPGVWLRGEGLPYFAVVRVLLDRCKTVDEALALLAELPVAWCTNFILSDRSGHAALVEVANEHRGVQRPGRGAQNGRGPFLCATNHYTLPEMKPYDAARRRESVVRYGTIVTRLGGALPHVDKEDIRGLLSEPPPAGVCLRHYSGGLGTLWSMICDVTEATLEVCFGAPNSARNGWQTFGLGGPPGSAEYPAHLPDEPARPGFWERLPPGGEG
jgi:predicted choloylglycine hydrolase